MTPQHEAELRTLARRVVEAYDVRAYLEIGARNGISLAIIGEAMRRGGTIVAVDMPGGPWGTPDSGEALQGVARRLRDECGHHVHLVFGDSRSAQTRDGVWKLAKRCPRAASGRNRPFDLVFIDADHSYGGVSADWQFFGTMGRIVVFDDIANEGTGVPALWRELKAASGDQWWTCEYVEEGSNQGKGVLTWRL